MDDYDFGTDYGFDDGVSWDDSASYDFADYTPADYGVTDDTSYFSDYLPSEDVSYLSDYLPSEDVSYLSDYLPSEDLSYLGDYAPTEDLSYFGDLLPSADGWGDSMELGAGLPAGGYDQAGLDNLIQSLGYTQPDMSSLEGYGPDAVIPGGFDGGMDFGAGVESTMAYNQAYTAAINAGLPPELAAEAAAVAKALEGSGMSMSDMVASGVDAARAGAAMGMANAEGQIIGGGGTIVPGLTGGSQYIPGLPGGPGGATSPFSKQPGLTGPGTGGTSNTSSSEKTVIDRLIEKVLPGASGGQSGQQQDWMKMLLPLLMMAMMNKGGSSGQAAVVPNLSASRTALPYDPNRRPGSAPQRYMSDTQYMAGGGLAGLAMANARRGGGQNPMRGPAPAVPSPTYRPLPMPGYAKGGISRLLAGGGDGTSDSIPATIDGKQPARLARGEFVVDARTVAELGNGSTDAGAEKLNKMVERVHNTRKSAKRGKDSKADRHLPA